MYAHSWHWKMMKQCSVTKGSIRESRTTVAVYDMSLPCINHCVCTHILAARSYSMKLLHSMAKK